MQDTIPRRRTSVAPLPFSNPGPWLCALQVWLATGALALVAFPPLRGFSELFGWLPFWLVVAPALDLAVLRRAVLAQAARSWLARLRRRRRRQAAALPRRRARSRRAARSPALAASPV